MVTTFPAEGSGERRRKSSGRIAKGGIAMRFQGNKFKFKG